MSKKDERRISPVTEKAAGQFLFGRGDKDDQLTESQFLDMRTRIKSESTLRSLLFYGILKEGLKSTVAGEVKDMIERLLIAEGGKGRQEAVEILRQQAWPKIREVEKGRESKIWDRKKKTEEE